MDAELHDKAKALFNAALQMRPESRADFLEGAYSLDSSLRAEVESLIEAHEEAQTFLERPAVLALSGGPSEVVSAPTPVRSEHAVAKGERIGPYQILHEIGHGGMGTVYEAEQSTPVRRKVAIKLVKWGMDTRQVIARFESERQALALMNHPNIASIYDAGATETGRPYFAMEFVPGVPITDYCDTHRLTIPERLRLFMLVCDGVQHAHQKGIIHRDIKPSNVLVTIAESTPIPKIIDFGLAKAVSYQLSDSSAHTELGQLVGTPEYMSPEQADFTGLDVDTRTDIYSLGALLYELLISTRLFESGRARAKDLVELQRRVRDEEPLKPSMRVNSLGDAQIITDQRRTDLRTLARELRGDLDWITVKALSKDRTQRYETADALKMDIQRHLRHEPVLARAPGTGYRLAKFIRRHRVGVIAALSIGAALVFGLVLATVGFVRARRAEQIAIREASTAKEVSDFLIGLFQVSDPSEARGDEITAREILSRGARSIDSSLSEQPGVQARMKMTMGEVYTNLGLYDEAEPLLQNAVEVNRRVLGARHPDTLASLNELANLYWYQNRFDDAERLYVELVEGRRSEMGANHPATLRAQYDLASLYLWLERYDDAEKLSLETLESQRRVLGVDHIDTVNTMHNLASMYYLQGRFEESARIGESVLEQTRRRLGEDHPDTLTSLHNLATSYHGMGRYDEAEELYLRAIELKRKVLGPSHLQTGDSLRMLGKMYAERSDFERAEEYLLAAHRIYLDAVGSNHERTKETALYLAELYERNGQTQEASRFRKTLDDR